jgi:hypothetical protein
MRARASIRALIAQLPITPIASDGSAGAGKRAESGGAFMT